MKSWSMYTQVNLLKIIYHLIAIAGIFLVPGGYWWLLAIPGYFLFTRIGSDIGFHRYFTHKAFKANKFVENLLLVLGTLDCKGSIYSWVVSHYAHHRYADKEGDPHSPHQIGVLRVWFIQWADFPIAKKCIADYLTKPHFRFTHDYYFWIVIAFMGILSLIDLKLLIYFYCVPMVYSIHMTAIINTVGHSKGYRNFETPDESRNNFLVNFLSLGGGLHNNHHAYPSRYDHSTKEKWHEIDPAGWVVEIIKKRDAA